MFTGNYFIDKLKLKIHPEGGYYSECGKSPNYFDSSILNTSISGEKALWTSIYYLLKDRDFSAFHMLKSDEVWYYHSGTPLIIYIIDKEGKLIQKKLGLDIERGEQPQVLIREGEIFGAIMDGTGYSLTGCMVSPGFEFADFEIVDRDELLKKYPQYEIVIKKLTRV